MISYSVCTTHLTSYDPPTASLQLNEAEHQAGGEAYGRPTIFAGDFNLDSTLASLDDFYVNGVVDPLGNRSYFFEADASRNNACTTDPGNPWNKIDFIFYDTDGFDRVRDADVIAFSNQPDYSDHLLLHGFGG